MSTAATTTTRTDIVADIQDVIYSVQHGARRTATLDETMAALMPLVERYATTVAAPLRAQLWDALNDNLVNVPEQLTDARYRAAAGRELRTILTRHLRADETR